ncbi:afadin- and alpha-actinin-binding protein isoform X3 [Syngnathoides biaculeatus]|uniref:afadin- and alpha-actinin-binding protein isoform X3 n=1 Tax=Syngnathoides biaculeatus TaxID=300417 RepID=UPI002ADE2B88|nr:afadin- and alpha-actinin-binding protein isoform X3 [Syngnathoides biaculeatus]
MASRFVQTRAGKNQELSENDTGSGFHVHSWEFSPQADSLREQLKEMDEHVARLQDMLKSERAKNTRLQLRVNQNEAELRRREQQSNRMKERLLQLSERSKDKGPAIEVLNLPIRGRGKSAKSIKSSRSTANQEEAMLRVMLERRESELREAMKLRHSLTTLLHAVRVDMEQTLSNSQEVVEGSPNGNERLTQAEGALGDHVTGGQAGDGTDHDKLLAQLEKELKESQQIVKLQQQMLQDTIVSPVLSELTDSYFLEEWERLQMRWADLKQQIRTFEKERQAFTDAAIRLSRERRDFENEKHSFLKRQYLHDSPLGRKRAGSCRTDFTLLGLAQPSMSNESIPVTVPRCIQGRVRAVTPTTPELYAVLSLSHDCSLMRLLFPEPKTEQTFPRDVMAGQKECTQTQLLLWTIHFEAILSKTILKHAFS